MAGGTHLGNLTPPESSFETHKKLTLPRGTTGWWLSHPSEKYESQLGWLFPIYGKIKNVPNHQSDNYLDLSWFVSRWDTQMPMDYDKSAYLCPLEIAIVSFDSLSLPWCFQTKRSEYLRPLAMALQAQVHPLQEGFTRTVGFVANIPNIPQLVNQNIKPTN